MQNSEVFQNIIRFIGLALLQVLVLNHINFLGYINPYLYILFVMLFPFTGNKTLLIFLGFFLGLTIDIFSDTGGVHAAATVFIAYIRPAILKFSFGISYEYNVIKLNKVATNERLLYISAVVILHHLVLFLLETFNISHILLALKSTLFSSIFSIILIFSVLTLWGRKR
ncbi:MAG: rod shape-determining protein MreD [Candidatus Azotimanducaceae bacterium]|jgi:rod shape-determining protein MreD